MEKLEKCLQEPNKQLKVVFDARAFMHKEENPRRRIGFEVKNSKKD